MTPKPLLFTRLGATCAAAVLSIPAYLVVAASAEPSGVSLDAHRSTAARAHEVQRSNGSPLRDAVAAPATGRRAAAKHATARRRAAHPAPRAAAAKPGRWLPTGAGMWVHVWSRTAHGNARRVVMIARNNGVSTLYVRTGSSHDGFTPQALAELLPTVRGANVSVVAWDFPELKNPVQDARRLAAAAHFRRTAHSRVMAVAPDIETAAEGTHVNAGRVRQYMATLRRLLPANVAILGTVPWPSRYRVGSYPYAAVAAYADALMPMAYWYDNNPRTVTLRSIDYLSRFHLPVMPVGQGYDSRIDVPSLPRSNQRAEVSAFMHAAKDRKVAAVSLWSWQTASPAQWGSLRWAAKHIRNH